MSNIAEIKYEDITIADEHLNGYEYDRCKNALWSIYNIIKKIRVESSEGRVDVNIFNLYALAKFAMFKDENMNTLVFAEYGEVKINGRMQKFRFGATFQKDFEKMGFAFSDFDFANSDTPSKKPNINKVTQFTFSYNGDDFEDVIFGLKLFADICAKYPGKYAGDYFPHGDISIAFKGANAQEKSLERAKNIKSMKDVLSEERFNIISDTDKAFILAFDKEINELGYDYGGAIGSGHGWGKFMIIYGKTGTKSRTVRARIYIREDGITMRFYFSDINKHRYYIESAPAHIKAVFAFDGGDCRIAGGQETCVKGCKSMKVYTINEQKYIKCCHNVGYFQEPTVERLPDYLAVYSAFYPTRKPKATK